MERKHQLRAAALSRRSSLSWTEFDSWSRSIQERVLGWSLYLRARAIALYSSTENEVATDRIRDHGLHSEKLVFYPRTHRGGLVQLIQVASAEDLAPGMAGILEPKGDRGLSAEDQRGLIVFIPGLAFDSSGNRLGRGKGCYDRLIAGFGDRVTVAGLAYEFQIVDEVPTQAWDRRVHYLFTERRMICCRETRQRCA